MSRNKQLNCFQCATQQHGCLFSINRNLIGLLWHVISNVVAEYPWQSFKCACAEIYFSPTDFLQNLYQEHHTSELFLQLVRSSFTLKFVSLLLFFAAVHHYRRIEARASTRSSWVLYCSDGSLWRSWCSTWGAGLHVLLNCSIWRKWFVIVEFRNFYILLYRDIRGGIVRGVVQSI